MNNFLGLPFGSVRSDACRPNSLNRAKLVTAIAAMLALSTTCADAAAKRVARPPIHGAAPIHGAPQSSYWMYQRCSPAARAADPNTVCFPTGTVRPYLGRDPDANVRLQMKRDYHRDNFPAGL